MVVLGVNDTLRSSIEGISSFSHIVRSVARLFWFGHFNSKIGGAIILGIAYGILPPFLFDLTCSRSVLSPSSEHQVAFGSVPSTLIPLNTTAISLCITFCLACGKVSCSLSPSCLFNISSVFVYAIVIVS